MRSAAAVGANERLKELLAAGENVEGFKCPGSAFDRSALILAANLGLTETVRILIQYGADVNMYDIHGYSALVEAVWRDHLDTVMVLLEGGADINLIPYNGEAALLYACSVAMTRLLIDHGADISLGGSSRNTFDHSIRTPLIAFTWERISASMRLLLKKARMSMDVMEMNVHRS